MRKDVTAIFDIGKTNKKFFLFDGDYQEVYREYRSFDLIADEDGHPTEDLTTLVIWMKDLFYRVLSEDKYRITGLNFSAYGASLVHIDAEGEVLTPLYNYTKPMSEAIGDSFFEKYGPSKDFAVATGSFYAGMLNSGLQLYWLKYAKPDVFEKIQYSLHLPQYLSYVFTGVPLSEFTSIGCHTALWDYPKNDYHDWVYKEGIDKKLAPIVPTSKHISVSCNEALIEIGVGIHDSSSALMPYISSVSEKFVLISTGTWSVALNPFVTQHLTPADVDLNCINYRRVDGQPVKAARLYLGNEYSIQTKLLSNHYDVDEDYHKSVKFDRDIYSELMNDFKYCFRWTDIVDDNMPDKSIMPYDSFDMAYHQLMIELVMLQVESLKATIGEQSIKKVYIDGGFGDNEVFIKLLTLNLADMEINTSDSSLGSALGAAVVISDSQLDANFLVENYSLKKHINTDPKQPLL